MENYKKYIAELKENLSKNIIKYVLDKNNKKILNLKK